MKYKHNIKCEICGNGVRDKEVGRVFTIMVDFNVVNSEDRSVVRVVCPKCTKEIRKATVEFIRNYKNKEGDE